MNATEARTFTQKSEIHEEVLALEAEVRGCSCQPYVDWFTYRRWQAQGFQVQRGERGFKLTTYVPVVKKSGDGTEEIIGSRPRGYSVFCRCQVKPTEK